MRLRLGLDFKTQLGRNEARAPNARLQACAGGKASVSLARLGVQLKDEAGLFCVTPSGITRHESTNNNSSPTNHIQ